MFRPQRWACRSWPNTAWATGKPSLAEVTGQATRSLPYYLDRLADLHYVRRRWPLTGGRPAARHVRFELADPLLRFWFRFVWPHQSFLARLGPARTFDQHIRPHLPAWYGDAFEDLCRSALPFLYADEGVTADFEVGEFWSKDAQIDVVGLRSDGVTDLGECRFGEVLSRPELVTELRARAARFPNERGATLALRVFSRVAPDEATQHRLGVRWHGLADLYAEPTPDP